MLATRVIPCLLLKEGSLVKTVKFKKYNYIGDPLNTVRIFNELEVDELMLLDIFASKYDLPINFDLLQDIASECFMPLSYGGNIKSMADAEKIFKIGFEKIVINSAAVNNIELISTLSKCFGSQSIIGSIDYKRSFFAADNYIYSKHASIRHKIKLVEWAKKLVAAGVGELLVTSIERDGTWMGYDTENIKKIVDAVNVPIIANGGAGSIEHIVNAVKTTQVQSVALASFVLYQKKGMGILVNFPLEQIKKDLK